MSIKSILVFGLIGAAGLSLTGCVEGGSYYADNSYSGYYSQSDVFYGGYGNDGFYRDRGYSNRGRVAGTTTTAVVETTPAIAEEPSCMAVAIEAIDLVAPIMSAVACSYLVKEKLLAKADSQ